MRIKNIIQAGELLNTEELAEVLGGNGARSNLNTRSCICDGLGDNTNGGECYCTNDPCKPNNNVSQCINNKMNCINNGANCTSNGANCTSNASACSSNGKSCAQ